LLDEDELLLESRDKLELILMQSEKLGFDGIELNLVNRKGRQGYPTPLKVFIKPLFPAH
jgi:hypothetical protein